MPKFPLHLGESGPTPWPTQVFIPNSMSIGSANNSILSLYFTIRQDMSPKKLPLPMGYPCPHLIMVRRTDQVHNPNGISIGSAVFVGLMVNRQTHRQTMQHRQQQAGYLCTLSMRCGLINTLLFPPTAIEEEPVVDGVEGCRLIEANQDSDSWCDVERQKCSALQSKCMVGFILLYFAARNQATGYASRHKSVPVQSQNKLGGLWQKGHSV